MIILMSLFHWSSRMWHTLTSIIITWWIFFCPKNIRRIKEENFRFFNYINRCVHHSFVRFNDKQVRHLCISSRLLIKLKTFIKYLIEKLFQLKKLTNIRYFANLIKRHLAFALFSFHRLEQQKNNSRFDEEMVGYVVVGYSNIRMMISASRTCFISVI